MMVRETMVRLCHNDFSQMVDMGTRNPDDACMQAVGEQLMTMELCETRCLMKKGSSLIFYYINVQVWKLK